MRPTRHRIFRNNVELKFQEIEELAKRVSSERGTERLLALLVSGNLSETMIRLEEEYWWRCSAEERRAFVKSWLLLDKFAQALGRFVPTCFSSTGQFPEDWLRAAPRLGLGA